MIKSPLPTHHPYRRIGLKVAFVTLVADQVVKEWLIRHVSQHMPIHLNPFLDIVMVWNQGVSFGMFAHGSKIHLIALSLLSVVIVVFLLRWLSRTTDRITAYSLGMIIGGAAGNVFDRITRGAVADFFYFHYQNWYWPAFNIADAAICLGVALLCLESMLARTNKTP